MERPEKITIGFVIYPGFNALDLVGPHEILSRLNARFFLDSQTEREGQDRTRWLAE